MTTFAPKHTDRRLEELEGLTREAWAIYSASVRELEGREYEEVERESWAELQLTLRAVAAERDELTAAAAPPAA
jgi:hypothetical protein